MKFYYYLNRVRSFFLNENHVLAQEEEYARILSLILNVTVTFITSGVLLWILVSLYKYSTKNKTNKRLRVRHRQFQLGSTVYFALSLVLLLLGLLVSIIWYFHFIEDERAKLTLALVVLLSAILFTSVCAGTNLTLTALAQIVKWMFIISIPWEFLRLYQHEVAYKQARLTKVSALLDYW